MKTKPKDKPNGWEESPVCNLCGGQWILRGPNDQTWERQCSKCHFIPSYWKSQFVNEYCDPNDASLLMLELLEQFENTKSVVTSQAILSAEEKPSELLRLILPLAKAYVSEHNVGSNQKYIQEVEDYLSLPDQEQLEISKNK